MGLDCVCAPSSDCVRLVGDRQLSMAVLYAVLLQTLWLCHLWSTSGAPGLVVIYLATSLGKHGGKTALCIADSTLGRSHGAQVCAGREVLMCVKEVILEYHESGNMVQLLSEYD